MLIVEDGTGLPGAEAYVSVAVADAYHAAFGNGAWAAATDPAKESAIRRATQYIDSHYTFAGEPLTTTQALSWPRVLSDLPSSKYAWPVKRVQDACAELALRALSGTLYADVSDALVKSETIGPISVEYSVGAQSGQTRFAVVDELLRDVLRGGGSRFGIRLERAS